MTGGLVEVIVKKLVNWIWQHLKLEAPVGTTARDCPKETQFLHVATTFSLKQGETRTSHGPIPHSLKKVIFINFNAK